MDDRFIRRIVTCMKNGSITATRMPQNSGSFPINHPKSSLKKSVRPQSNVVCLVEFWRCDSLGVCSKWGAVDADLYYQQLEWVYEILRRRYPALLKRNRVLLRLDNAGSRTARIIMTKFRNREESNCYHTQHTALILHLEITICFDPCPISCVKEISKALKLCKWVLPNSSHQKPDTCAVAG